jgi:hypothetical protein
MTILHAGAAAGIGFKIAHMVVPIR